MRSAGELPLVSVIIPAFNAEKYLEQTALSVLNQTYRNIEIMIVDDGSCDRTWEIIKALERNDSRIRGIKLYNNSGRPAVPRNHGLRESNGEYIAFLDADDLWCQNKLERQVDKLRSSPDINAVATNGRNMHENLMGESVLKLRNDKKLSFRELLVSNPIINSSLVMKRELIEEIGFLDEDPRLRAAEDYDYWLKILKYQDNSILIIKDCLTYYRIHGGNVGYGKTYENAVDNAYKDVIILGKYINYDSEYVNKIITDKQSMLARWKIKNDYYKNQITLFQLVNQNDLSIFDKSKCILRKCLIHFFKSWRFAS